MHRRIHVLSRVAIVASFAWGAAIPAAARDREFWQGIVDSGYAVPEGESAAALLLELSELLGSTDPEERDGFGYYIPAQWIYRQQLLSPEELRPLLRTWSANLAVRIGRSGNGTLLRSFSALDLSLLAAYDNREPFLTEEEFRKLLDDALTYLAKERDLRGFIEPIGWVHTAAHTADLLKFLGRSRHLGVADQRRILDGIAAKMTAPGGHVFTWGEDERLAHAILSIVHREDFDAGSFAVWLQTFPPLAEGIWEGTLDTERFAALQNAKNLLRAVYVLLRQDADAAAPLQQAGSLILETMKGM